MDLPSLTIDAKFLTAFILEQGDVLLAKVALSLDLGVAKLHYKTSVSSARLENIWVAMENVMKKICIVYNIWLEFVKDAMTVTF